MSVASQIELLASNKAAIKTAIEAKNPIVIPTNELAQWPTSIASIPIMKPEQEKTATPTASGFIVTPDSGKALSSVVVNPVTSSIDVNIIAGNIKKNVSILGVTGSYEGSGGGLQGYSVEVLTSQSSNNGSSINAIDTSGDIVTLQPGTTTSNIAYIHMSDCERAGTNLVDGVDVGRDSIIQLTKNVQVFHYWSDSCFLKGTLITLANKSEKMVEDITFDDELLVWDFDNGCFGKAKPIWIKKVQTTDYWFLNKYRSGKILKTTGKSETGWGHRTFDLNKNKFIYTTESVSDNIFTLDGIDTHMSCERIEEPCEYYNIITEHHFNLFANRILTSCSLNNLYPIKDMKYVKDNRTFRSISDYDNIPKYWFDGLRLAENNTDINKLNKYVKNLMEKNNA